MSPRVCCFPTFVHIKSTNQQRSNKKIKNKIYFKLGCDRVGRWHRIGEIKKFSIIWDDVQRGGPLTVIDP